MSVFHLEDEIRCGKTFTMGSGYAALSSATATLANSGEDNQTNVIMNLNDLDEVGVKPRVLMIFLQE
ncbi:unnamed protein product [Brachionus calyciflorus]|uniref:Uncharacterized protein n=1 Tax=Brachionus calyciflorus TaxID=104777 RepID=A0A814PCJ9_9BILA|nr:unnamed protein product [Brachionus calyciflorus]